MLATEGLAALAVRRDPWLARFQSLCVYEPHRNVELLAVDSGLVRGTADRVDVTLPDDRASASKAGLLDVKALLVRARSGPGDVRVRQAAVALVVIDAEVRGTARPRILEPSCGCSRSRGFLVVQDNPDDLAQLARARAMSGLVELPAAGSRKRSHGTSLAEKHDRQKKEAPLRRRLIRSTGSRVWKRRAEVANNRRGRVGCSLSPLGGLRATSGASARPSLVEPGRIAQSGTRFSEAQDDAE